MAKSLVVLSFYETLLHQSDVDLLIGPYWLNDMLISFYFEYLEKVVFKNATNLLFVSPEVTQCIKMVQPDEIKIFLEPLNIAKKEFVFFALNDNNSPDTAGGSHWSLLVYSMPESCFYHFDSSASNNHDVAWDFSSHMMSYLVRNGAFVFKDKECQQQSNGYDCGIHVICNTERLAHWVHKHGQIGSCDMSVRIDPSLKRKEMIKTIEMLAHKNTAYT